MGQLIFPSGPGRVVGIREAGVPFVLRPEGWNTDAMASVITSLGMRDGCNFQISRSLRRILYVYTFGDEEADIKVGGLTFSGGGCFGTPSGVEGINLYYQTYKLSRTGRPLRLAIGARTVRLVYLTGLDNVLNDPATGVGQFTLSFTGLA